MAELEIHEGGLRLRCGGCGKINRIPFQRLGARAKCGGCSASIGGPIGAPADVRDERAFQALLAGSPLPILVDFWAPWCGPCRMVAPQLDEVAARRAGRLLVVKVDTQALPQLGARLGVSSIPTMATYHNGRELRRISGARPAAAIESFVDESLAR